MISFLPDGTIQIDGFPDGPVTVRPPTYGGLKRLRAERVRVARDAEDKIDRWEAEHPAPEGEEADTDPHAATRREEDRLIAIQDANHEAAIGWWRLILVGDDSFAKLADGKVPDDADDWPAELIFDVRPLLPRLPEGQTHSVETIMAAQSTPDRIMRHFGLGRSRSSSGESNGQVTNPQSLAL